jgi:hypothetical protein
MRRVAIILFAATFAALPAISHAQYNDNDQQNPKEYHDEDSQPLAIVADLLYPVGFAVEWLLARPLHYVANDSPASPIYRPVGGDNLSPPPPVPIIPDNTMDQASSSPATPQDWSPTRAPITTNATVIKPAEQPAEQPAGAPPATGQPALH